jgi:hypothetical protein
MKQTTKRQPDKAAIVLSDKKIKVLHEKSKAEQASEACLSRYVYRSPSSIMQRCPHYYS